MSNAIEQGFIAFLATVDLPRIREQEYLLRAATAFVRNEVRVMRYLGSGGRSCLCIAG